jgi:hypothetical protein
MFCRDEFGEHVYVNVGANQLGGDASARVNSFAIGYSLTRQESLDVSVLIHPSRFA